MWTLLSNLVALIAAAFKAWNDEKLRNEGRQEATQEAQANADHNEAVAADAGADPAVIERVRSRWDRARRSPTPES